MKMTKCHFQLRNVLERRLERRRQRIVAHKRLYCTAEVGDFVEYEGDQGRIVKVDNEYCLVWINGLIRKVPKSAIKVTLSVEEHLTIVAEEMDKLGLE